MNPEHAWIAPVGSDPDDLDGWTDVGYVREDPQPELEEQHACYCLVPGTYRDTGARHYFQAATCERERPVRRYAVIDGVWHDRLGMRRDRSLASGTVRQYFCSVTFYPTGRIETRADGAVGEHMGPEEPQSGNDEPWRIPGGFVAEFEGGPLGDECRILQGEPRPTFEVPVPDDDRGPWDPSRDRSPWRSYRTHTYQLHWVYTWGYRMPVYVSEESERRRLDRCEHVAGTFVEEQDRRLEQERARAAAEGTADRMLRELEDARATLRRIAERAANPARPSDLLASRFCAACEVHWTGGLHCWSCGNEGEIKAQPSCYDGHSPIPYGYGTDPLEDPDIPEVCRTCFPEPIGEVPNGALPVALGQFEQREHARGWSGQESFPIPGGSCPETTLA